MINIAVEGDSDREAAKAVLRFLGKSCGKIYVAGGKTRLDPKIVKYNAAARHDSWVVFRDSDSVCPVELKSELTAAISNPSPKFSLRIAHSMIEAWLLADRPGFATFFHVSPEKISANPEELPHAKREVLRLCARSRSRGIREAMVGVDGNTGPLYVPTINEFASTGWNVEIAMSSSPSLCRAVERIRCLE